MKRSQESSEFHQRVEALRTQITQFYAQDPSNQGSDQPDTPAELLEALYNALEELGVSEEELRQQNEELLETRQELEDEFSRYSDLFDSAPDGYLVTDYGAAILAANHTASQILNIDPGFLVQKPLYTFVAEEDHKLFIKLLESLRLSGDVRNWRVAVQPRKDLPQRKILFIARVNPNPRGPAPEYLWLMRDITNLDQKEAELAELKHRLYESVEAERTSIAREIHDGPIQDLYSITFMLKGLSPGVDPQTQADVAYVNETIRKVVDTLRSICGELRPPALAPFGLSKAIRSHAEKLNERNPDLKIDLHLDDDRQVMPERIRLALYRIYQQLIMNSLRHAQASRISVSFQLEQDSAILLIKDNGSGFEVPESWIEMVRSGHYGLAGTAERVETLGGTLDVVSSPGKGTRVRVSIPISANKTQTTQQIS
jgi:signal transduction histidine kinase